MTQPTIRMPFLITSREWPLDAERLSNELNKAYTDIALAVNRRTIGIFDKFEIVTGEYWYNLDDPLNRRQSYRQVYTFTNIAPATPTTIAHGLKSLSQITRYWGSAITNIPDFRIMPYPAIDTTKQIEINVDATNINIETGTNSPTLTSGFVVLEYILES